MWEPASKQEIISAYQKSCEWFSNTSSYFFRLKYTSFKDAISNIPLESSEGYYKRVANNCITEAMGIKTIQNQSFRITVDTSDKLITIMDPGNLSPAITSLAEMETLLGNTKSLKKARHGKKILFRIEFYKNEQFEAYEFLVNEKGILESLTYYYSEQTEKVYSEKYSGKPAEIKSKPRLEIRFFGHEIPARSVESEFTERTIIRNDKGKLSLVAAYRNYRILDYRLQTSK